jgi:dTDP-4-amino-4,6-dideoxygalactose transaminase
MDQRLAVLGGTPVRRAAWPAWPPFTETIGQAALAALQSGRWAISGAFKGAEPAQRRFERAWADYVGSAHCVSVSSGSSALVIALQALGIGPGDEVIVPVWTWVATASTVLRVGARPVFVDVSPDNFCMSVAAAEQAITPRTRAIMPVHLHHSMADMDGLLASAGRRGISVVEDAAQAHGAIYRSRRAGALGRVGAFSFQQTKVLTSGEGGALVTDDADIAQRAFELHADSRVWQDAPDPLDGLQLSAGSGMMGANHGLSEIHAAILLAQLADLDGRLERTARNAARLDRDLAAFGVQALRQPAGLERRTVFEYLVVLPAAVVAEIPRMAVCRALKAELGCAWYPPDMPLHCSPLFRPDANPRFKAVYAQAGAHAISAADAASFPVAEDASSRAIVCHHSVLSGSDADMADIVAAFDKVLAGYRQLRGAAA